MPYVIYPLVNVYIARENGPVEIVDLPIKHGWIFHSYVSFPEDQRVLEIKKGVIFTNLDPMHWEEATGYPEKSLSGAIMIFRTQISIK